LLEARALVVDSYAAAKQLVHLRRRAVIMIAVGVVETLVPAYRAASLFGRRRCCVAGPGSVSLPTGVCRTPPVRGKGSAHLLRRRLHVVTRPFLQPTMRTRAVLKEVVRV
jgi:hypothetical protein